MNHYISYLRHSTLTCSVSLYQKECMVPVNSPGKPEDWEWSYNIDCHPLHPIPIDFPAMSLSWKNKSSEAL